MRLSRTAPLIIGGIGLIALMALCAVLLFETPLQTAQAQTTGELVGYAWSDMPSGSDEELVGGVNPNSGRGAGWISFNCQNEDSCGNVDYGVSVAQNGLMSGQAWSEHVGWISFAQDDLSGCPSGFCEARVDSGTGAVTGWARALAATTTGNTGGWDGWIHLAGTGYGVTVSDCKWSGYAWGGDVLGWIKFSGPGYGVRGVGTGCNQVVVTFTATPSSLQSPGDVTLAWAGKNAATCTGSNFSTGGATSSSALISVSANTIYGIVCTSGSGSASKNILVTVNQPFAALSLLANPTSVQKGKSAELNWSAVNVNSCTVTDPDSVVIGTGAIGSASTAPIQEPTIFTLSCDTDNGPKSTSITVGVIPNITEI